MTWFKKLWGINEPKGQRAIEGLFHIEESSEGVFLTSSINGRRAKAGRLELPQLNEVRTHFRELYPKHSQRERRRSTLQECVGDIQKMHQDPQNAGAMFQVASQVNLLEMASPNANPMDGVEIYEYDRTQGPACAISAGAGTVYRNYFMSHGDPSLYRGQLESQVNTLDALHSHLRLLSNETTPLWTTKNGYVLPDQEQLKTLNQLLEGHSKDNLDHLRGLCKIGLHWDVEVTLDDYSKGHEVNQAYCSALPLGYSRAPSQLWEPFAKLVLEAAYEHTLKSAAIRYAQGGSAKIFLTKLGGGVFQNPEEWIYRSIYKALKSVQDCGLDIRMVSYGRSDPRTSDFIERWHS